jgi:hypothetical protein
MRLGEGFGLPGRDKPRVRPTVMAHGQRPMTQVDNLHHVRMAARPAGSVIMVAHVRGCCSARCHLSHLRSTSFFIHDPPPPHSFADAIEVGQQRQLMQRHFGHVAASG